MRNWNKWDFELEQAVLTLPEFLNKNWKVQTSTDYSVTLKRNKKEKEKETTEEVVVYASYVMKF